MGNGRMNTSDITVTNENTLTLIQVIFFNTISEVPSLYDPALPEREIIFLARDTFKGLKGIPKPDLAETARKALRRYCDNHPGIIKKISIGTFEIYIRSFLQRVVQVFEAFETPPLFFFFRINRKTMSRLETYFHRQLEPTYYLSDAVARIPGVITIEETSAITI